MQCLCTTCTFSALSVHACFEVGALTVHAACMLCSIELWHLDSHSQAAGVTCCLVGCCNYAVDRGIFASHRDAAMLPITLHSVLSGKHGRSNITAGNQWSSMQTLAAASKENSSNSMTL
eukprot:GHRQ01028294.1.p1 GENE.GHRQ01028294.1~~GHRQ01028294.1.p1  ORF type:complete len:119 (-),score=7.50 GHRQ01028294.1:2-358(-)